MSKATRMLAMTGMALAAGMTIGAGPAAASTSTAEGTTSAKQSSQQQADTNRGREWVEGYYRSRLRCEFAGRRGERFNRWDDYECERVRRGFRVLWRLDVERDWRGGGNWNDHHQGGGNDWNDNHRDGGNNDGGGHWNRNHGARR